MVLISTVSFCPMLLPANFRCHHCYPLFLCSSVCPLLQLSSLSSSLPTSSPLSCTLFDCCVVYHCPLLHHPRPLDHCVSIVLRRDGSVVIVIDISSSRSIVYLCQWQSLSCSVHLFPCHGHHCCLSWRCSLLHRIHCLSSCF